MPTKKALTAKKPLKKKTKIPEAIVSVLDLPPVVTIAKKTAVKSVSKSKTARAKKPAKQPETIVIEEVTLGPTESLKLPVEVSKEYIVVHRCANCEHIPFSVTKLVTLFSILIVLLSISVLIQVGTIDVSKLIAFVSPIAHAATLPFVK